MGLYWYTFRKETKVIDGIEIGRYGYAYKESSSARHYPGSDARKVRSAESRAEDAVHANRAVRHFVMADSFTEACEEGYWVFQIDHEPPMTIAAPRNALIVGYIRKEGGRFVFRRVETRKAA